MARARVDGDGDGDGERHHAHQMEAGVHIGHLIDRRFHHIHGIGPGADIMQPLAISVTGGLLDAMLLTPVVIPCLYPVNSRGSE